MNRIDQIRGDEQRQLQDLEPRLRIRVQAPCRNDNGRLSAMTMAQYSAPCPNDTLSRTAAIYYGYWTETLAPPIDIHALKDLFHPLPLDRYVPQGYRYKALARYRSDGHTATEQAHGPLYQPSAYNSVAGGIVRHYAPLPATDGVRAAVTQFAHAWDLTEDDEILVQAQRTVCVGGSESEPAVEGFHRDNIACLAIVCIERANIIGGKTKLADDDGVIEFAAILEPGELLMIADSRWLHYTSSIRPADPKQPSYRDVLLLSSSPGTVNRPPSA